MQIKKILQVSILLITYPHGNSEKENITRIFDFFICFNFFMGKFGGIFRYFTNESNYHESVRFRHRI